MPRTSKITIVNAKTGKEYDLGKVCESIEELIKHNKRVARRKK